MVIDQYSRVAWGGGKEEQGEGSPWGLGLGEGGKQGPTNQGKALYTFIYIYIYIYIYNSGKLYQML